MTDDCTPSSNPSPSDSSDPLLESWEVVAAFVEPFLEEWESGAGPPLIEDHLPGEPQYRRDVLLELVKVDIDYRQQYGLGGNRVEDYVDVYPEILVDGVVPSELVLEEFQIRRGAGESVTGTEYLERFPEHRSALEPFLVDDDETVIPDNNTIPRHAEFVAGDRLDDFYIMSKLGQGAFASVYLARQDSMQRLLALKVSADKGSEAQTLAQLDHPHIVRVYDQHRIASERLLLLYMQFAPGGTLHSLLAKSRDAESADGTLVAECVRNALAKTGVLSPDDVFIKEAVAQSSWIELTCHFGIELARALEYAHGRGVLHRDLKPANVLLDANGSCKLADFNISFASEVAGQDAAQSFGGSVAYMPPEQLAACHPTLPVSPADVDERCDTYALGVLLWEFATGKRPFNEADLGKTWSEILEEMIRRRELAPTEGEWDDSDPSAIALRRLLLRCLRSEPSDRVASASALADELSVCREPVVASISNRSENGWERLVADWAVPSLLAAIILPNVPAALFALFYNNENLQLSLANPSDMQMFDRVQSTINGIAFPTAIALLIWYCRKISRGLRRRPRPSRHDADVCKRRMFRIALFGSSVGIVEWTIAAIAYPVTLHFLLDGLSLTNWGHFFFSHVLSGMIAAAYPFFIVTTLLLRSFLPRWLTVRADNRLSELHEKELDRVGELSDWFLLVAGAVPALGIFALLFLLGETDPQHEFALKILSLLGAFGFAVVFWLYRRIQADLDAYRRVIRSSVSATV